MTYTAPFQMSNEYVPIPTEGTFLLPVCTNAERLGKILSALYYGGLNTAEVGDMSHLVDVLDAMARIRPECDIEPTGCTTWVSAQDRVTFFPTQDATDLPLGYAVNPWVQITGDNPLVGLKRGDVISDIFHMPILPTIWDNLDNPLYLMTLGYPTISIENLEGAGTVRIYMVGIILGGKCMVIRDRDPFSFAFLDTNIDTGSLPPETYAEQILEYEFQGVGSHRIDIVFFPNASLDIEFLGYGAGFRRVEICGFEENEMAGECCDETNVLLQKMLDIMQNGFKIVPLAAELPNDFTVDCTPDDFGGNEGDDVPEQIMRYNAMCLAINRWLVSILANAAVKMNQTSKLPEIWALAGFTSAPTMYGRIQFVENDMSIDHLNTVLDDDTAFLLMVCRLMLELVSESNTFTIFKKQFDEIYADVSTEENPAFTILAMVGQSYSKNRANYALFSQELERAYEEIEGGSGYDCNCATSEICDEEDYDLIAVNDCTVTRIDATHWRIQQTNFTDAPPDKRAFTARYRDRNWKCFNVYSYSGGMAGYDTYGCDGVRHTGVGGGGGLIVQDGIIHLEYDSDPVVGLDIIAYVICP